MGGGKGLGQTKNTKFIFRCVKLEVPVKHPSENNRYSSEYPKD